MRRLSRTVLVALALVVLVALAGCNFLTGLQSEPTVSPPDPENDTLGWENGYWYNETLEVTNDDGLNASEREAVVSRAMARVERVRQAEFDESVPVDIISREEYRDRRRGNYTDKFRTFDNAKFEAMFFVGEDTDSIAVQRSNLGSAVLGYYSPSNDSIKLVAGSDTPSIDGEGTLAHELVHALQDQRHNLSAMEASTRDEHNAQNGLVEGEANFVQDRYMRHCRGEWSCVEGQSSSAGQNDLHYGIYLMEFFPYSDGPSLVSHLVDRGGWSAVDDAFEDLPTTSEQVIYPERYTDRDDPVSVDIADDTADGWERLRPDPQREGGERPDHATLGQSVMSSMFMYTAFDGSRQSLVSRRDIITGNSADPLNYDYDMTDGWEGDRLHVYTNGDAADNETAYVWRSEWESADDAEEFAEGYRQLLEYHDGNPTRATDTWRISDGQFADAFRVSRDGTTVTIVNAPTTGDLADVHPS